jgi:hypothetical protein
VSDTQARLDAIDALEATIYQAIGTSHVHGAPLTALRKLTRMAQDAAELERVTAALRREWWMNHGCEYPAMYGDDGEMQCANGWPHHLPLDFKRQPVAELEEAVRMARLSRIALAGGARAAQEDK